MSVLLNPPDPKAAETAAREAIRIDPGWFFSYYQLGWALELQARYGEAITTFEYGLQLNPDYRTGYLGLGRVHLAQGNHDQALAAYEKARGLRETPDLLVQISAAHAGRGDMEKSLAELEQALAGGYRNFDAIEGSPYFAPLRADPRFQALLAKYEN